MTDNITGIASGFAVLTAVGIALRALAYYGPNYIVGKLHMGFELLKTSTWVREPTRPARAKLLLALVAWLEEELPDPGTGTTLYKQYGEAIANSFILFKGTQDRWAVALEKIGDSVDTELDKDIIELTQKS